MVAITASLRACGQLGVMSCIPSRRGWAALRTNAFLPATFPLLPRRPLSEPRHGRLRRSPRRDRPRKDEQRAIWLCATRAASKQIGVDAGAPIECSGGPKATEDM